MLILYFMSILPNRNEFIKMMEFHCLFYEFYSTVVQQKCCHVDGICIKADAMTRKLVLKVQKCWHSGGEDYGGGGGGGDFISPIPKMVKKN